VGGKGGEGGGRARAQLEGKRKPMGGGTSGETERGGERRDFFRGGKEKKSGVKEAFNNKNPKKEKDRKKRRREGWLHERLTNSPFKKAS